MENISKLAKYLRYLSLASTTKAGSGHATSSLSAADLMAVFLFGGYFRYDLENPDLPNNDRLIFSKGHASPLFYALWVAAGAITEGELMTLRQFDSKLGGHPTNELPYTEVPTGSLGQGLSVGVGMAINAKYLDKLPYKTYVLVGDSELAEGQNWEAIQLASYYKLDNLVMILDVNRLGQRGETMLGYDIATYQERLRSFGWETVIVDGHNLHEIGDAFTKAQTARDQPVVIIAKTVKGRGISFLEDKENWHGRALTEEELDKALAELGEIDKTVKGKFVLPENLPVDKTQLSPVPVPENYEESLSTRQAYGHALVKLYEKFPTMVVMDGEVSNSTFTGEFNKAYPSRFFEMFIAEQNMVSVALGLAIRGKIPFVSTFAAFFTRAFDQIRMAQYAGVKANIKFVGSHVGVSIGEDGPSQMGLEDISQFRVIQGSVVLYPSDHVSEEKLTEEAAKHQGLVYIRTTREKTPPLYKETDSFPIGGSKVLRNSPEDCLTVVAAGITLHEALAAYESLEKTGIKIRVIDLYSIKPIDKVVLEKAAVETRGIIVVEDHYPQGGMADAVREAVGNIGTAIYSLAVTKIPRSGKPQELLSYEEIDSLAIIAQVKKVLT